MATVALLLNKPNVTAGIENNFTFTIPADGPYNLQIQVTENPPSGLVIEVDQNSSPIFTTPTFSSTQSHYEFKVELNCVQNDVIDIFYSSSEVIDTELNTVKSIIIIGEGY